LDAIKRVYASILNPDALLYRQRMGLVDYDERMAVLIQKVQGFRYRHYFFPTIAGVGYSHNPFRWNPRIRREDGFLRLVCGLGTRAVERVANDYPRMIALSHPQLRPEADVRLIRKYSQHFIDLIDLEDNSLKTLPISETFADDYPALRILASMDKGGYLAPLISRLDVDSGDDLVLTFEQLTHDRQFITLMKAILKKLERCYNCPVDIEFTVEIQPSYPQAGYTVHFGRLNKRLEGERFILMGPGRWGTSNLDLGVKVTYADIYNTKVLVEIPLVREGSTAEASYGTHFFQDLVEAGIFPLPVTPGKDGAMINYKFLAESPNALAELLPDDVAYSQYVRVIDVPAVAGGCYLEIIMNGEEEQAVGYLTQCERRAPSQARGDLASA
jgi:hypothetical protein